MAMIQGIDGMMLINALRAGQQDRKASDAYQLEQVAKQGEIDAQKTRTGLMGRIIGGGGGVAGQYGAPAQGGGDPPGKIDQNALREYIVFDPENGKKMVDAFKAMDEGTLKQWQAKNDIMGAASRFLRENAQTPQERQQLAQVLLPQLLAAGWTEEELAKVDLSDRGLQAYEAIAIDYDKMMDNALNEREFQRPRIITPQPGGGAFSVDSENNVSPIVVPNEENKPFGAPAGVSTPPPPTRTAGNARTFADYQALVQNVGPEKAVNIVKQDGIPVLVDSPEQARSLPSGTRIMRPDGAEGVVP